LQEINVKDNNQ